MEKSEGLPGIMKAIKLIGFIEELKVTDEERKEAWANIRLSDTTHGLLWGDIANFRRETQGLDLIRFLCDTLTTIRSWQDHESYALAVRASMIQKIHEEAEG